MGLDVVDRKVLVELDKNVRVSNAQIAKKLRLSKDVVNYRISRLQRDGILTGFYALPRLARLGNRMYKVLLKFQSLGTEKEAELLDFLGKHPHVAWLGSCDGNWNLIITVVVDKPGQLSGLLKQVYSKYGLFLSRKEVLLVSSVLTFNEKYLYPRGELVYEKGWTMLEESTPIDAKDRTIIQELSANARASTTSVAAKLGLTPEATAKRIKNLLKQGLIVYFKPRISFQKLGLEYFHVFVTTKTPETTVEMINYYKKHPNCVYVLEETSYYDMNLEFVVESTQKFREVLKDLRDRFGEKVHEYEPLQIYSEYKINPYPSAQG